MDMAAVLVVIDEVGVTFSSAREMGGAADGTLEIGGGILWRILPYP